jgi:hypothetical protein
MKTLQWNAKVQWVAIKKILSLILEYVWRLLESSISLSSFEIKSDKCQIKSKMERLNPVANNVHIIKSCGLRFEPIKSKFHEAFGDIVPEDLETNVLQEEDVLPSADSDNLGP